MDGFTKLPKMQHFKEGGKVKNAFCGGGKAYKKGGEVSHEDIVEDKKLIKKAFNIHDKQEHEGEKTDLSKLKKGGRSKKEAGTVRKFKDGGAIGMKKDPADIKEIAQIKKTKVEKLCMGGKAKKYADGGIIDTIKSIGTRLRDNVMGTPEQNAAAQARMDAAEQIKKDTGPVQFMPEKRKKKAGGKC